MEDFGQNLRRIRSAKGLSQTDLAKQLCISNNSIVRYEQGRVEPKIGMVVQIAGVLDCSVDELCGKAVERSPLLENLITQLSTLNEQDLAFVSGFVERL